MIEKKYPIIGLLGGTFDPVHNGHIAIAEYCTEQYDMQSIQFIPNQNHNHKPHVQANALHRVNMLNLNIKGYKQWHINTIELSKDQPAYTIDTVKQLKQSFPQHALCFILSIESFNSFNTWKNYLEIIDHCHLIILGRSGHSLELHTWQQQLLSDCLIENPYHLENSTHGRILLDPYQPPAITSTDVRNQLYANNQSTHISPEVNDYIKTHDLY